jgi:hypothetical protein
VSATMGKISGLLAVAVRENFRPAGTLGMICYRCGAQSKRAHILWSEKSLGWCGFPEDAEKVLDIW